MGLSNGEEVHATEGDELEINPGMLSLSLVDGSEKIGPVLTPQ